MSTRPVNAIWPIPRAVAGVIARAAAPLVALVTRTNVSGVEKRLRGMLYPLRSSGLRIGRRVEVEGRRCVRLGRDVLLNTGVFLSATGAHGAISIGDHTHVDRNGVLYGQGGLSIGSGCAIAAGVLIYSQTNRFDADPEAPILAQGTAYAPVAIGDDVWIGAGAVIVPGVSIGDHAVVAAGAVVTADVAPWSVVAGVPARVVKSRRPS